MICPIRKDLALSRKWRIPTKYKYAGLVIGDVIESVNEGFGLIVACSRFVIDMIYTACRTSPPHIHLALHV
jgi:hypothetical protein